MLLFTRRYAIALGILLRGHRVLGLLLLLDHCTTFLLIHRWSLLRVLWWNWLNVFLSFSIGNLYSTVFELVLSVLIFLVVMLKLNWLPFGSSSLWQIDTVPNVTILSRCNLIRWRFSFNRCHLRLSLLKTSSYSFLISILFDLIFLVSFNQSLLSAFS